MDNTTYPGSAYHSSLGNEMAFGEIVVSQWTLTFRSEVSDVDFPLLGLGIDVPEADPDRVSFVHPDKPGWKIYTSDFEILENRHILGKTALRQQIHKIAAREQNWRKLLKITVGFVSAFMLVVLAIFLITGWTLNFLITKIPASYETQIGNDILAEMREQVDFINDTNTTREIEMLTKGFIPAAEQKRFNFRFFIVQETDANAMALPGGNILVTTGLLKMAETPEELAGVLAHEVAHVTQRHGVKHVISQIGPYLLLKTFLQSDSGFLGLVGAGSTMLVTQGFSQKYEMEADSQAWEYLTEARINPEGMITLLEKLKAETAHLEEGRSAALSSHPPTADRIKRLEAKWKKLEKSGFVELSSKHLQKWK